MKDDAKSGIKSAYDLAMERMAQRGEGLAQLTAEQKARLAELAVRTKAKIAEIEIMFGKSMATAKDAGDPAKIEKIEAEMRAEIRKLKDKEEAERKAIRGA